MVMGGAADLRPQKLRLLILLGYEANVVVGAVADLSFDKAVACAQVVPAALRVQLVKLRTPLLALTGLGRAG